MCWIGLSMEWLVDESVLKRTGDLHVIPLDDLKPHECSRECWCRPEEDAEGWDVFRHHALDGRERHQGDDGMPLH